MMAQALFLLLAFVAPLSQAGCSQGMYDLSTIGRGDICMDIQHTWPWREGVGEGASAQHMVDEYGEIRYCNGNFFRWWHAAQMTCWREGKRLCTLSDWQAGYNSDVNLVLRDSWSSARYGYVGTAQNANRKHDGTCYESQRVAGQFVNDLEECKVYGHMVSDQAAYRYKKAWYIAFNESSSECRVYGSSCNQNTTSSGFVTYTLNNNCYITNNCCNANVQAHGMDGCYSDRFFKCCSDVCPLGTTRNTTAGIGAGHCTVECPMGTFGVLRDNVFGSQYDGGGEPVCELCPRGSFSNVTRSTECLKCPAGTSSEQGASECITCPAGRWGNANGMSSCTACSAGKYSTTEGSTNYDVCLACPAGKSSPTASTECIDCPVGRYASSQGQAECTICGPGKFGKASGELEVIACQACEAGKSSTGGDQSACHECPPGYVSDGFRSEADPGVCAACAPMKFEENNVCKDCPAGKFSLEGSDVCSDCSVLGCAAAVDECTNADDGSCSSCEAGYYSTAVGDLSKCEACPYGKTSAEGQTTCTNFDVPSAWLQFTQSDSSNRGSAYSPSLAYGVEVDTSDEGARLLGASISIDGGVVMNKQCHYCGDRPGNDFVYLGSGQCKKADSASPVHTNEGTMTFDACLASAVANPAVVGMECNGGYPDACVCQHFTETVIRVDDVGDSSFVCMVRSSGADPDPSCCVDELTAYSAALSADDDQEEMCRTAMEYRQCLGSEDCLNAAQANEAYCEVMQICHPAPACGEVTWQLGGSYTDYSVGCMSGCDGDSFVDLTLEQCQDACLDTAGCRSIDFFENQPSGEITCVLSTCVSPNPDVDAAATDCRYYEWSYQDTSEGDYTVAFWSKVTGTEGDRFLLDLHGLSLYVKDGGLDGYIQDTAGEEIVATLPDGEWVHTVMTYASGAADATVKIYTDGALAVTRTTPKKALETLSIGGCDNLDFFVEYEGTILAEGPAESAEECMTMCAEDLGEDCEFWTYSYASQICKGGKDKTGEVLSDAMAVSALACTFDANFQDLRVYNSVLSLSDIAVVVAQQAPVPTLCEEGLFWDNANNKCSVCRTTCGDGKYITIECNNFNDIFCEPCLTSCVDGQLRTNTCDGRQNNYCAADANQLCEFDRALCAATLGTGLLQPAHSD